MGDPPGGEDWIYTSFLPFLYSFFGGGFCFSVFEEQSIVKYVG